MSEINVDYVLLCHDMSHIWSTMAMVQ